MEASITLPPQIRMEFNRKLLSTPLPKFREWSGTLRDVYEFILFYNEKRVRNDPKRKERFNSLKEEFLKLYASATIKEEELKEKTKHPTQRPFYSIGSIGQKDEKIFRRIKCKSLSRRFVSK